MAKNPSAFAGIYNAVNFAYGQNGVNRPGPLVVASAPSATGAGSLVLTLGYITLPDGAVINPLSILAPVLVGSGSNAETVTPSAVSVPTPGLINSTTLTATFSNLHGAGDSVGSATGGLQEALNYAGLKGGGTVIIDNEWALLVGSSASSIIAAATLPSGVTIWDNRSGASLLVQSAAFTVTNAEIKALNTTPVLKIAAPGASKFIDIIDAVFENVFLTAAFANGGAIGLTYGSAGVAATPTIAATFLTSPAASQMIKVAGVLATNLASDVLNKAIYINCATADFITGSGSMKVKVNYRILDFS